MEFLRPLLAKIELICQQLTMPQLSGVEGVASQPWGAGWDGWGLVGWSGYAALLCELPGFGPRTRLREIILANNCTMQGQNNWGNWGSPGVMKLWVAWEMLRWLMKFRELCSGGFIRSWLRHPTTVSSMWTLSQIVKIQNGTKCNAIR